MVGYIGCANLSELKPVIHTVDTVKKLLPAKSDTELDTSVALEGKHVFRGFESNWAKVDRNMDGAINDSDKLIDYVANTDTLLILRPANEITILTASMASTTADIPIGANKISYKPGDLALVADCLSADLVIATENGTTAFKHGSTLSKAYGTDAMLMPLDATIYYIRSKSGGGRALYRLPWRGNQWQNSEEVVDNVEAMQIVYGLDTNGDGSVDDYRKADTVTDWSRVLAVRVSLLLRSNEDNLATNVQTYSWDSDNDGKLDDPVTATDRRLRYVYTTTIALRNRMVGMP